jgi:hypothetical protein
MPRALVPCLTIVAAFQLHVAAAEPLYEDIPVPAPIREAARAVGLDAARDPALFLSDFIRLMHATPSGRLSSIETLEQVLNGAASSAGAESPLVPVPLTAAIWSRAVFDRQVEGSQLFHAIAADRRASLLAYGLTGVDDATLAFIAERPDLISAIYNESAAAFAAFADSIRIRDGRVAVPGGSASDAEWTLIVGARPDDPAAFIRGLLFQQSGRLGYLFDLVAKLEPAEAAFAVGAWIADPLLRSARFMALAGVAAGAYGEWSVDQQPFARPLYDLSFVLMRVPVDSRGAPTGFSTRSFWSAVFEGDAGPGAAPSAREDGVVDAAWLSALLASGNPYARGERLDQFSFAQRVFGAAGPGESSHVLEAVRAFRLHRTLLLALERMGITSPRVYRDVVSGVSRTIGREPDRAFWQLSQLQGSIAVIARLATVGTIDREQATRLVTSLVDVPLQDDGRYRGGIARWIQTELLPVLPDSVRAEARLLRGLAGPANPAASVLEWEGQQYRLDFAAAEFDRLIAVRERQASYSIDLALAVYRVVQLLDRDSATPEARSAAASLSTTSIEFARDLARSMPDILAPGVRRPPDARAVIASSAAELSAAAASNDTGSVRRVSGELADVVDSVLGEALLSIAYAMDLGDPGGTALLGRNVAMRHDFGLSHPEGSLRMRLPWSVPRQDFRPGVAWRVTGSLVGLDIALAPLGLRRLSADLPPQAPSLSSIEREAFAVSLALLEPRRLSDEDRRSITAAIGRGRSRVAALSADAVQEVERLAEEIGMGARRQHLLRWTLSNDSGSVPTLFSLVELLALGGSPRDADLDAWGMGALTTSSCACTRLLPPQRWRLLEGRPQLGIMAAVIADLNLHMAVMLDELEVPAPLTKSVLSVAVQEFIEQATPIHMNDWRGLFRAAQSVSRERIEDYVAAAAAVGGPLVPVDADAGQP